MLEALILFYFLCVKCAIWTTKETRNEQKRSQMEGNHVARGFRGFLSFSGDFFRLNNFSAQSRGKKT